MVMEQATTNPEKWNYKILPIPTFQYSIDQVYQYMLKMNRKNQEIGWKAAIHIEAN